MFNLFSRRALRRRRAGAQARNCGGEEASRHRGPTELGWVDRKLASRANKQSGAMVD